MTEVFNAYSRLKAPVTDVKNAVEETITPPDGIEELQLKEVNGKLQIQSVATDDSIGRYTPTAIIKAGLKEEQVVVEEDGTLTHQKVSQYEQDSGWGSMTEETDITTETVEYANFYGDGDDFLVHDVLRGEMFEVLCQITEVATKGHVQGIILEDGKLTPVRYEAGGENIDVELEISKILGSDDENNTDGNTSEKQWKQFS